LTCAITGTFEAGKLKKGKFGKVSGVDFDEVGMPVPRIEILRDDVSFTYDPSMSVCISRTPLTRDPYEHQVSVSKTFYVSKLLVNQNKLVHFEITTRQHA
jgi:hypothetical protein